MSDVAEVGVRHAFILEKRDRRTPHELGFSQINYGRLFIRDRWTLFAIARELDCSVEDILSPPEVRNGPRWSELITASEKILETVRALPGHMKILVTMRGEGLSWRRIQQEFPGRTTFSMKDDHSAGISTLRKSCGDHLNYLASFDKFIIVRGLEAA